MTEPRDRVRDLIADAVRREQFEPRLDAILRELVDVIDAEPELRRAVQFAATFQTVAL